MTPKQLWADRVVRDCLLEAGSDVAAALEAAQYILATQPMGSVVLANVFAPDVMPLVQAAHEATNHVQSKMALDAAQRGKWGQALMHHLYATVHHHDIVNNTNGVHERAAINKRHIGARDAHITAARAIIGPEGARFEDLLKDAHPHEKKQQLHNVYGDWLEDQGFDDYARYQRLMAREGPGEHYPPYRGLILSLDDPSLSHEGNGKNHTHEELHEVSWKAYDHGMKAVRSGDKEAHAHVAQLHREAAEHRTKAAKRTKGHERDAHRKMAWAHESSAKMHDAAAKGDAALSVDDFLVADDYLLAITKPGFHPMHHKVEAALDAEHLTPEHRERYNGAHYVLGRMSKTTLDRAHANTNRVLFHYSHQHLVNHANATGSSLAKQLEDDDVVGGYFSQRHKTLNQAPGLPELGGSASTTHPGVFAHEVFHAISGSNPKNALHNHQDWRRAYAHESHSSDYARDNGPDEEFAEFGRLTHGSDLPLEQIEKEHPLKTAFFKQHDLWPISGPQGSGHVAELFDRAIPLEDGGHIDVLKQPAIKSSRRSAKIVLSTRPEEETDASLLMAGVGSPSTGALDTAKTPRGKGGKNKQKRPVFKRVRAKRKWKPETTRGAKFATDPTPQPGIFARVKSGLRSIGQAAAAGVSKVVTALDRFKIPTTAQTGKLYIPDKGQLPLAKGENIERHTGKVRDALAKVGITDPWNTPWHDNKLLRRHALVEPEKFDRLVTHLNHHLTQAIQFGANTEVMHQKMRELQHLQQTATKHREDMALPVAQLLPEHYGRKGAANTHVQMVLEHLEGGGDATSAVTHLVQRGGLNHITAKRYVKTAIELAKQQAAQRQLQDPAHIRQKNLENKANWPGGPTLSGEQ